MASNPIYNILLADDDIEDHEILIDALYQSAPLTKVKSVYNGQEVLRYLADLHETEFPDMIILDYKMPILNAAEVLQQIGHDQRFLQIPKIVWSTSKLPRQSDYCLELGAIRYFVKPRSQQDLAGLVKEIFEILMPINNLNCF